MIVKLMTDAPKHNLALMKISAHHKAQGDTVFLGKPNDVCDVSYASWLFSPLYPADHMGGPGYDPEVRLNGCDNVMPDYSLYPDIDYSVGYTWTYCPRRCDFCVVRKQPHDKIHHSIHEFHNPEFSKICLLNNNTFTDPRWRETFHEIWDADLTMLEHGLDLRLLDAEKIDYLNQTKIEGQLHFAWDRLTDAAQIMPRLPMLKQIKHGVQVYVLIGYEGDRSLTRQDMFRCALIARYGLDPYVMVYNRVKGSKEPRMRRLNQFERMVNHVFTWRKYGFSKAWERYIRTRG